MHDIIRLSIYDFDFQFYKALFLVSDMAKRYRGEEVLDMMDRLDTSNDEDSSDDETIVGNTEMLALSSSDDNSSDEEMIFE